MNKKKITKLEKKLSKATLEYNELEAKFYESPSELLDKELYQAGEKKRNIERKLMKI